MTGRCERPKTYHFTLKFMKRTAYFLILTLVLFGCNSIDNFLHPKNHPAPPVPDLIVLDGTTAVDYQIVQIRTEDSDIGIRILDPYTHVWRTLNRYEYDVTVAAGAAGAISFQRKCYPTFNSYGQLIYLVLTGLSVAPPGTQYEITSEVRHIYHALY